MPVVLTSDEENRLCVSSTIFIVACGFLSFGVYSITAATAGARAETVSEYSIAVDNWKAVGRAEFDAVEFTASIVFGPADSQQQPQRAEIELERELDLDLLADHDIEELPQYAPLKYSNGGDTDPIGGEVNFGLDVTIEAHITATYTNRSGDEVVVSFNTTPEPAFVEDELVMSKGGATAAFRCQEDYDGQWNSARRRCVVLNRAAGLCTVVTFNESSGAWSAGGGYGLGGCTPMGNWRQTTLVASEVYADGDGVEFDDFMVMLRSSADPFLKAENLTDSRLDFGLTGSELTSVGLLCLFLGCVLCINPAMFFRSLYKTCKRGDRRGRTASFSNLGVAPTIEEASDDEDDAEGPSIASDDYMGAVHGRARDVDEGKGRRSRDKGGAGAAGDVELASMEP